MYCACHARPSWVTFAPTPGSAVPPPPPSVGASATPSEVGANATPVPIERNRGNGPMIDDLAINGDFR